MFVSRSEQLNLLRRGVEVLVIGGGITGAGVALDAASRGYCVGLVDQAGFASGTSSRSTKLVHGGIRYLPQGHVPLVRQALLERKRLLRLAPHLVRPLPFVLPLYAGSRRPLGLPLPSVVQPFVTLGLRAGLTVYDWFARDPSMRHRAMSLEEVERDVEDLRSEHLRAAFVYYDARTDDVWLTHAVLATARQQGAITVNYARLLDLRHTSGRVAGALIEDRLTGTVSVVDAKFVVNAAGVWAEHVAALDGSPPFHLRRSAGTHLVLRPGTVRTSMGVVIPETDDGRIAFIVPWADRFVLGTTDVPYSGDLSVPVASAPEVAYLLDHANRYLRRPLGLTDVASAYAGLRPLLASSEGSTAAIARDHQVAISSGGLISIVGGKLTTYRKMAEDAVDTIARAEQTRRQCVTASKPLAGSEHLDEAIAAMAEAALAPDQRTHLLEHYGAAANELLVLIRAEPALGARLADGVPVMAAEVVYACRAELAVSLADCLYLHTRLAVLDAAAADHAASGVAMLMARHLGWDPATTAQQLRLYEERREREQGWKR